MRVCSVPMRLMAVMIAAAVLGGCALLRTQVEAPRVSLAAVGVESLGLLEQRFRLTLRVQNPNGFPIRIAGLDYKVALSGESFASGVSAEQTQVPASGEALITVPVTANLLNTVQQVLKWRESPPQVLDYSLDGGVRLRGFDMRMPFEYQGTVPIRGIGE